VRQYEVLQVHVIFCIKCDALLNMKLPISNELHLVQRHHYNAYFNAYCNAFFNAYFNTYCITYFNAYFNSYFP